MANPRVSVSFVTNKGFRERTEALGFRVEQPDRRGVRVSYGAA